MRKFEALYRKIDVTPAQQEEFFVKVWFEIFCAESNGKLGEIQSNMLANKNWFKIQFEMATRQFLLDTKTIREVDDSVYVDYVKNHFARILPHKRVRKLHESKYNLN